MKKIFAILIFLTACFVMCKATSPLPVEDSTKHTIVYSINADRWLISTEKTSAHFTTVKDSAGGSFDASRSMMIPAETIYGTPGKLIIRKFGIVPDDVKLDTVQMRELAEGKVVAWSETVDNPLLFDKPIVSRLGYLVAWPFYTPSEVIQRRLLLKAELVHAISKSTQISFSFRWLLVLVLHIVLFVLALVSVWVGDGIVSAFADSPWVIVIGSYLFLPLLILAVLLMYGIVGDNIGDDFFLGVTFVGYAWPCTAYITMLLFWRGFLPIRSESVSGKD